MTSSSSFSAPTPSSIHRTWWKESSVYQIYPSSFQDSNTNPATKSVGHGDIPGIISRLDYIHSLGVDSVWLSPVLASPQIDMGYDISDYRNIHAAYGTMEDHDNLIRGLHERGMKYVMDLVVNHTSDQHEWFQKSRAARNEDGANEFRDWYIWRPAKYDRERKRQPPNNWLSNFGGSAWEWDAASQEYYLHLFARQQPDLNWEHPPVIAAVHAVLRFWLRRGVDGFRMDVINFISKEPGLPDAPVTDPHSPWQSAITLHSCGPRLHEWLRGIGAVLEEFGAFSVGEMPGVADQEEVLRSVGQERGELNMIFHFELVSLDSLPHDKFLPRAHPLTELKAITTKWQTMMLIHSGWNALYLENHDQPRAISRFGSDASPAHRTLSAKMLATHLALQAGTPYLYQGQELGMVNLPREWALERYRDLETLRHWQRVRREHAHDAPYQEMVLAQYRAKARDNARTPMQWDGSTHAGFTRAEKPWMDVHPDYAEWNVERQVRDPESVFCYWREVFKLRKQFVDVFVYGGFEMLDPEGEESVAYVRRFDEGNQALVVTSFSGEEVEWLVPEAARGLLEGVVRLRNYEDGPKLRGGEGSIVLRPFEALVFVKAG